MSIYKVNNSSNSILYSKVFIEEFLFLESPDTEDLNFGNNNVVAFQFMVNSSTPARHGLRLKTSHVNGRQVVLSIDIDEDTGNATLMKSRSNSSIPNKMKKDIVILAGAFAMYSLEYLRKAFGYFEGDNNYIPGDESFAICVKQASENFNALPKHEKDKYLRKSKSTMKIE